MPVLSANQQQTIVVPIGQALTLSLGVSATCTLVEITDGGLVLTPIVISLSPTVLGPYNRVRAYNLFAVNGSLTYTLDLPDPSLLAGRLLSSGGNLTAPANTAENILVSVPVPAGILGPNGQLRAYAVWSMTNNVNAKTLRTRLGGIAGTVYTTLSGASMLQLSTFTRIQNKGSQSSQMGPDSALNGFGSSTAALITSTVDTSLVTSLDMTAQKATGGDTVILESYSVEIWSDFS